MAKVGASAAVARDLAAFDGKTVGQVIHARYRTDRDRGRALAALCRPRIARVTALVLVATAMGSGSSAVATVSGLILIVSACAAAAALNDLADVESDRTNGRTDRPLVSGPLDVTDVRSVVRAAAAVTLLAQLGLPQPTGLVVSGAALVVAVGSAVEPVALQRRGLIGLVALALGYLVLPVVLGAGLASATGVLPLALLGAGVLAHKDVRDEVGDRAAGKQTLLVRSGPRRMAVTAAAVSAGGLAGLVLTVGVGSWLAPGAWTVAELSVMAATGHSRRGWLRARLALVATAVLIGLGIS